MPEDIVAETIMGSLIAFVYLVGGARLTWGFTEQEGLNGFWRTVVVIIGALLWVPIVGTLLFFGALRYLITGKL